jgi:hypothetical protein
LLMTNFQAAQGGGLFHFCRLFGHRVISLRCGIWSRWGHSGY